MNKKRKNLMISFGKLSEEDLTWDIKFWQTVSTEERFAATSELIRTAYRVKTGKELIPRIDKSITHSGTYRDV